MSLLDQVVSFVRVLGSRLLGSRSEPVYNLSGIDDFAGFGSAQVAEGDSVGETDKDQVGFSALGIIGRPLPPDANGFAQAVTLRSDGGLSPIGWRDMRLCDALNPGGSGGTPAEGQLCFAGYGGAMLSHSMTDDPSGSRRANIGTWYVPYSFDAGGVPQKALTVSLDPVTETITLLHPDGMRVDLTHDGGTGPAIVLTVDGSTFLRMAAGELTLQAAKIMIKGNVYLGAEAEFGVPLLAGPASPPGPSVFISPV